MPTSLINIAIWYTFYHRIDKNDNFIYMMMTIIINGIIAIKIVYIYFFTKTFLYVTYLYVEISARNTKNPNIM